MNISRTITYIIFASLLTGCGSFYSSQVIRGTAESTTLEQYRPQLPRNVILYPSPPPSYRIIGLLRIENTYSMGLGALAGIKHDTDSINESLKTKAASLGANGLIDINRGEKMTTAKAIITP